MENQEVFHNQETQKLLRAKEVAEKLNISTSLAYKLMQAKVIPIVHINRSVRVKPCDLDAYINKSWSGWESEMQSDQK